jgi:hypothetical protein
MGTVYRKSAKGQTEIETRTHRLVPRLRTALILVDGHRTDNELAALIGGDATQAFRTLLEEGFIEVASRVEERAAPRPAPSAAGPGDAGQEFHPRAFERRQREAAHALTDQVGPLQGDAVAVRLEKCRTWAELLPVLQLAHDVVRNARGAEAAADFARRFIDTPPA